MLRLAECAQKRRYDEIVAGGGAADYDTILEDIRRRGRDMGRADSPLKPLNGLLLVTSNSAPGERFHALKSFIDALNIQVNCAPRRIFAQGGRIVLRSLPT